MDRSFTKKTATGSYGSSLADGYSGLLAPKLSSSFIKCGSLLGLHETTIEDWSPVRDSGRLGRTGRRTVARHRMSVARQKLHQARVDEQLFLAHLDLVQYADRDQILQVA